MRNHDGRRFFRKPLAQALALAALTVPSTVAQPEEVCAAAAIVRRAADARTAGDMTQLRMLAANRSVPRVARVLSLLLLTESGMAGAAREFVAYFPTSAKEIKGLYLCSLVTDEWLEPFEELTSLATAGRRDAIKKVLQVASNADGHVAEQLCDGIQLIAEQWPRLLAAEARRSAARWDGLLKMAVCLDDAGASRVLVALHCEREQERTACAELRRRLEETMPRSTGSD